MIELYPLTALLALLLGASGLRSGSLSKTGAAAAALLGYATLANPVRTFGVALLAFYFAGSKVTKVKHAYKATLEDPEHSPSQPAPKKAGGNRSAFQVASNAWFGSACAVAHRVLFSGEFGTFNHWRSINQDKFWIQSFEPCVIREGSGVSGWSTALVLGAIAFWAACAGDTFASELGILSSQPPRLITTLRSVPRGTNGGVSPWGLLVSFLGGLLVGVASVAALLIEDSHCRTTNLNFDSETLPWWGLVLAVSGTAGLVGSLLDSVLGATVQRTVYSPATGRIVHHESLHKGEKLDVRGLDILSNNGVNVVSSTATALGAIWWIKSRA